MEEAEGLVWDMLGKVWDVCYGLVVMPPADGGRLAAAGALPKSRLTLLRFAACGNEGSHVMPAFTPHTPSLLEPATVQPAVPRAAPSTQPLCYSGRSMAATPPPGCAAPSWRRR